VVAIEAVVTNGRARRSLRSLVRPPLNASIVRRTADVSEGLSVEKISLPIGASELLRYFEGVDRGYPDPHWRRGAEMCRKWLRLTAGPVTQQDVDEFVRLLNSEVSPGSGWLDLGMQFRAWAQGLWVQGMMPSHRALPRTSGVPASLGRLNGRSLDRQEGDA